MTVSETQARSVLAAVAEQWDPALWGAPNLIADWDWYPDAPWTLVWEEGPYCWAIEFSGNQPTDAGVPGVFVEPHTQWALGIYPS